MTKANKVTRPGLAPRYPRVIFVAGIPTNLAWNVSRDSKEFEVVRIMPEGQDDVLLFSSRTKERAEAVLREEIEKAFPGLLSQHPDLRI